jgi:hypothetical protein
LRRYRSPIFLMRPGARQTHLHRQRTSRLPPDG